MSRKAWKFNNGARLDQGLSMSFSRGVATKDPLGVAVAAGTPRYARRSILCGAPNVTAVSNAESGSWNVMTTGVAADGSTPVLCLADITSGKLHVFQSSIVIDGSGNSTYVYDMTAGTSTYPDALKESADKNDDGLGTAGNFNFKPNGSVCYYGRIDLLCSVAYRDTSPTTAWRRNRVGVMSCNVEDLSGAKSGWWRKSWVSPEAQSCDDLDQTNIAIGWAMQSWSGNTFDGSAPTEVYVGVADYESTSKRGGMFYVCRITRPSASSGTWTPGVYQQAFAFSRPTSESTAHAHGAIVVPAADGSAVVVMARGDGHANNAIYSAAVADLANYDDGSSAEGAGSYNSNSGGTGIGTPAIVNGRIGGFTGSPPPTVDSDVTTPRMSYQPVGMQRGSGPNAVLFGGDEQHVAIMLASSVPTSGGVTLTPVYVSGRMYPTAGRASVTSPTINSSRLCLQLITRNPCNPTAEVIANVTPQSSAYQQDVACHGVYSPNGVEFGICWNTKEPEQARPGFFGSSIIIGSPVSRGYGVRTIPVPSYLRGRPLMVDAAGTNYLATSITPTKSSGMISDGASELNTTEALPSGYTPAPGYGTPIYFATNGTGSAKFVVPLCNANSSLPTVTAGTDQVLLVQFAIHAAKVTDWRSSGNGGVGSKDMPAPASGEYFGSNSCSQVFRFRFRFAGSEFSGYTENIYIPSNDGTPHILTIPVVVSAIKSYSTGYTLEMLVESSAVAIPMKGWLTPIGVYADDVAPCPVTTTAGGTTIPATALTLSGFTLPTTGWTAYWSGKVPSVPHLDMVVARSHTNTTATRTSATVTRLANVPTGLDTVTDAFAGHRLFGTVNSTSTPFGNYGLAISASAYVSTGVHDLTHTTHSQGSGSWSQIDVTCPGASASARPVFALCNTDNSRRVAVYLDCVDGTLKVRYWNGSAWGSYATLTGFYFVPECPVHVALAYDGAGTLTVYASCGGSEVASTTLSVTPDQAMTKMIAGDGSTVAPMEWWAGLVVDEAESASQRPARLCGLSYVPNPARTRARRNRGARAYASR